MAKARKLAPPRASELAKLEAGRVPPPIHELASVAELIHPLPKPVGARARSQVALAEGSEQKHRVQLSLLGEDPDVTGPASDECYTPSSILDPVVELLGGIDTDPCWSSSSLVRPRHGYAIAQDGLTQPWYGTVWLNPPYSNPGEWVKRAAEHAAEGHMVAALLSLDPSTKWWRHTLSASSLGLWPARVHFAGKFAGGGAARFSSALVLWNVPISACVAMLPRVA